MRVTRTLATAVSWAAVAVALAGGVAGVLVARDTIRVAHVASGSMRPGIPVGALVAGVPADGHRLAVGDVVMFRPPAPFADAQGTPVAHRVVAVETQPGRTLVRTRGDANAAADPWLLDAAGTTFYRVTFSSLAAGRLTAAIDPTEPRAAANLLLVGAWLVTLRLIWGERRPPRHRAPRPARGAAPLPA